MDAITLLVKEYGLAIAIAIVFVWQSVVRENRMVVRLDKTEDYIAEVLQETLEKNTAAMNHFSEVCERCRASN